MLNLLKKTRNGRIIFKERRSYACDPVYVENDGKNVVVVGKGIHRRLEMDGLEAVNTAIQLLQHGMKVVEEKNRALAVLWMMSEFNRGTSSEVQFALDQAFNALIEKRDAEDARNASATTAEPAPVKADPDAVTDEPGPSAFIPQAEDKTDLMREYERETGGRSLLSEPGRAGVWASSGYVFWLEEKVNVMRQNVLPSLG